MNLNELLLLCLMAFVQAADSQTDSNVESLEKLCRICLEEHGLMISPCACTGSHKWVHPKCLRLWQRSALLSQPNHVEVCTVCKSRYTCNWQEFPRLIKAMWDGDQEGQAKAAADLINLALSSLNQNVIRKVLHAFIDVLHDGSTEAQKCAAAAVEELAAEKQDQLAIREQGGIQALVKVLREGSHEAQAHAASALRYLAVNSENEDMIRESGGIQALIKALQEGRQKVRMIAADALRNLLECSQQRDNVMTPRALVIQALMGMPVRASPEIEKNIAAAIQDLARNRMTPQVIRALVKVLREGSPEVQKDAAVALRDLARNRLSQMICKEGGIQALIEVVHKGSLEVQKEVVGALSNLAVDNQNKVVAGEYGENRDVTREVIQALIGVIREGNPDVWEVTAGALKHLMNCIQNCDVIREENGTQALIKVLREGSHCAQASAAAALNHFVKNTRDEILIRGEGGIQALTKVLREGRKEAQADAAHALRNLAVKSKDQVVMREVVQSLIGVLNDGSPEACKNAAAALKDLAENKLEQTVIHEEGGIQILIEVLRWGSPEAHASAARALQNLAGTARSRGVIHKEGGILALIKVLHEGSQESQKAAVDTLRSLVEFSQQQEMTLQVIQAFIGVLRNGSSEVRGKTAADIVNLTLSSQNQDVIPEVIQALIEVLHDSSMEAWKNAAGALGDLAKKGLSHVICKKGGMQALIKALKRSPFHEGSQGTRKAGSSLIHAMPAERLRLEKSLLAMPLRILQKHESKLFIQPAAEALCHLVSDGRSNCNKDVTGEHREMICEVIQALISVTNEGSLDVWDATAGALRLLSKDCAIVDVIHEERGIETLVKVLREGRKYAQINAALALRHLAEYGENYDVIREVIHALIGIICEGSPEAWDVSAANAILRYLAVWFGEVVRQEGGIQAVIKVLREGNSEAQKIAAGSLKDLAENKQDRVMICKEGGMQAVVEALCEESQKAETPGTRTFQNLHDMLKPWQNEQDKVREVIPSLIRVLREGSTKAWETVADALANLIPHSNRHARDVTEHVIREERGIQALVKVLHEGSQEAQAHAVQAFRNLAANSENQNIIREVVQSLIGVLHSMSDSPAAYENAAIALKELTEKKHSQVIIREEGGIQALVKVVSESRQKAQKAAAQALESLAKCSRKRELPRELIQLLIRVLHEGSQEARKAAAEAFGMLAKCSQNQGVPWEAIQAQTRVLCDGNVEARETTEGIQTLTKMLCNGSQEVQDKAAAVFKTIAQPRIRMIELRQYQLKVVLFMLAIAGGTSLCIIVVTSRNLVSHAVARPQLSA